MDLTLFFRGLILGITIAAPVGPTGVLCMQRALAGGKLFGFASGLGASTAHGFFAFIAAFGLTTISTFVAGHHFWFRLGGGIFICYLGLRVFLFVPPERISSVGGAGYVGAYASIFLLTLLNPITALFFFAVFPGFGTINQGAGYGSASMLVMGVFAGSALWWFILSGITNLFRDRMGLSYLRWINRISGGVIILFGVIILLSLAGGTHAAIPGETSGTITGETPVLQQR